MTTAATRILFCHCAHAQILPRAVQDTVLRRLAGAGAGFEAVDDLCGMAARKDPRLKTLATGGPLKIAACYPRAVKWLFAAADAPLPRDAAEILNLRVQSAEEVATALLDSLLRPNVPGAPPGAKAIMEEVPSPPAPTLPLPDGEWKPWFPVIDYDRCTHCMQCLGFCLFGVFGVNLDHRIQVQNPASCKANCPACSRVCPEAAIIFPKYHGAPINGAAVGPADLGREKMKIDISAVLGGDIYDLLRTRSQRAKTRFSAERDPDHALQERRRCLAQLAQSMEIPPKVLATLPSPEEIHRKAEEALAKARAALDRQA